MKTINEIALEASIQAGKLGKDSVDRTMHFIEIFADMLLEEALQSPKSTLQASETPSQGVDSQEVEKALRKAFMLGRYYNTNLFENNIPAANQISEDFYSFSEEFSSKFKPPLVGE